MDNSQVTNSHIIVIAGKDGSGKSTLAKRLQKLLSELGVSSMKFAFATALREMIVEDGLLTRTEVYAKPTSAKARTMLRKMSIQYKLEYGHDVFANRLFDEILKMKLSNMVHVIDDMRYLIEMGNMEILEEYGYSVTTVFLGDDTLRMDEAGMPSFRELPEVRRRCQFVFPRRPGEPAANFLVGHVTRGLGIGNI